MEKELKNLIENKLNKIINMDISLIRKNMLFKENFVRKNPKKIWILTICADIILYKKSIEKNDKKFINELINCFQEGGLEIFRFYDIKNIEIVGNRIFGVVHALTRNHAKNPQMDNFFKDLDFFLSKILNKKFKNIFYYKISIAENSWL